MVHINLHQMYKRTLYMIMEPRLYQLIAAATSTVKIFDAETAIAAPTALLGLCRPRVQLTARGYSFPGLQTDAKRWIMRSRNFIRFGKKWKNHELKWNSKLKKNTDFIEFSAVKILEAETPSPGRDRCLASQPTH